MRMSRKGNVFGKKLLAVLVAAAVTVTMPEISVSAAGTEGSASGVEAGASTEGREEISENPDGSESEDRAELSEHPADDGAEEAGNSEKSAEEGEAEMPEEPDGVEETGDTDVSGEESEEEQPGNTQQQPNEEEISETPAEQPGSLSANDAEAMAVTQSVEIQAATPIRSDKINDITWSLYKDNDGSKRLVLEGTGDYTKGGGAKPPWSGLEINAAKVNVKGITSTRNLFFKLEYLESVDLSGLDTGSLTDMAGMFAVGGDDVLWDEGNLIVWGRLASLDLTGLDVKRVTDMGRLFSHCGGLRKLKIDGWKTGNVRDMSGMFEYCAELELTADTLKNLDTSQVTNMSRMFAYYAYKRTYSSPVTDLDLSGFRTLNVENMSGMFDSMAYVQNLDISSFRTSNVTDMSRMFAQCVNLRTLNGVGGFDTGNVTNMSHMFAGCKSLKGIEVSDFDTSSVTNMNGMFAECGGLGSLDLGSFDMGKTTDATGMLDGCTGLKRIGVPVNCKVDVALPEGPWYQADGTEYTGTTLPKNLSASMTLYKEKPTEGAIKSVSVSGVTMSSKEYDGTSCSYTGTPVLMDEAGNSITGVTITPSYSGSLVDGTPYDETDAAPTLAGSYTLSFQVSNLDTGKYRLGKTAYRFSIRRRNVTITAPDVRIEKGEDLPAVEKLTCTVEGLLPGVTLSKEPRVKYKGNIDTQKAGAYEIVPYGAEIASPDAQNYQFRYQNGKLQVGDPSELPLAKGSIEKIKWEIDSAGRLTLWGEGDYGKIAYYGNKKELPWTNDKYRKLVKSAQVKVSGMTATQDLFNGCENLVSVDLGGFDASRVTNATGMFAGCSSLKSVDLQCFKKARLQYMGAGRIGFDPDGRGMFAGCSSLTEIDVSCFNMSEAKDIGGLFYQCTGLKELSLNDFQTKTVTWMTELFAGCSGLEELDVSGLDTRNVRSMNGMFAGCSSLKKLVVNGLDTKEVTDMGNMFSGCSALTELDVSGLYTGNVTAMYGMFSGCSALTELDLSGFDTRKVEDMSSMFLDCRSLVNLDLSGFDMTAMGTGMMMGSVADGMFSGCNALSCLLTPRNYKCEESVALPKQSDEDIWKDREGKLYTELPRNRADSVLLYRNNYLEDENGNIKQIVTVSGVRMESKIYDGQPCVYVGTAVLTDLDGQRVDTALSYLYQGTFADGSAYKETVQAPAQAGSYTLTVKMPDGEASRYILKKDSYPFTIGQRSLIVSAPSLIIEVGGKVPVLGKDLKWSAEGLIAGEKFLKEPALRFDPNPVLTDRAGSYKIIPDGADAGNNYRISYQNGALLVGEGGDIYPEDLPSDGVIPEGLWIAGISAMGYGYTGKAQKPVVRVYDHKTLLKEKTDYTVSYRNNTKAYPYVESDSAFDPKKAPTVTVTGRGNYTGRDTQTFRILPLDIGATEADGNGSFAADDMTVAYNKKAQKPVPALIWYNKKLKNRTDYTFAYYGGDAGGKLDAVKEAGEYSVVLSGKGNFTGTKRIRLLVTADLKPVGKLSVANPKALPYTGSAVTPQLTVKDGRTVLTENTHYTVAYSRNTAVGTAYAVVKGIETAGYSGTKRVSFKITGISVNKAAVTGLPVKGSEFVYGGLAFEPQLSLSRKEKKNGVTTEIPLTEGTDYTVEWQKNREAGTASVIFTGKGAYTGAMKKTFKIKPFDMAANENNRVTAALALSSVPYAKGGAKPKPEVVFQRDDKTTQILEEGRDYTLSYKNQSALYDGSDPQKKPPTVTIKGKGCFKGTYAVPLTYQITPQNLGNGLRLTAVDKTYRNKKNSYATKVSVTDLDGKALKAGADYDKNVTYTYRDETTVQTAPVKNVSPGGPAVRRAGDVVEANDIIPAGTVICVTVKAKDGGNYTGTLTGEYRISKSSIASAAVSIPKQTYTGQPITLKKEDITVKVKGRPIDENQEKSQWEIVPGSYKNNVKKGTASVTIRGVDNYGGEKTVKFAIKAKGFLWWWR